MNTLRYPPSLQWEVTSNCNHNCIHCYNYWRKDEEKIAGLRKQLTADQYETIAKKIIEQKPVSVVITGGEPFLVFDRIKNSVDLFLKNKIAVSFNSNVTCMSNEIADFLHERNIGIFVSVPSANPEICDRITNIHGSGERLIEKLDLLHRKHVRFTPNIVVSKLNLNDVEKTVGILLERYQLKKISITRVGKPVNSQDSFNRFLLDSHDIDSLLEKSVTLAKKYNIKVQTACPYTPCSINNEEAYKMFAEQGICTAGKTSYAIDTDGNVKACPRDGNLYGNILNESFETIWNNMSIWRDGTLIPNGCKNCNKIGDCFGGCRVGAYPSTLRLDMPDVIANMNNVPIKYSRDGFIENFSVGDKFKVAKTMQVLQDKKAYRLSNGRRYTFVTQKLWDFISKYKEFTLLEMMEYFSITSLKANNVVKVLLNNNIIIRITERSVEDE